MADQKKTAIIAIFDKSQEAEQALVHAKNRNFDVDEGIVVNRDSQTGKVRKHLANLPGAAAGAGVGAVGGAVLAAVFPPAALAEAFALAIGGAVVGAGAVALKDEIIDRRAFDEVAEALGPGQSALVVVMNSDDAATFEAELEGYVKKWSQEVSGA